MPDNHDDRSLERERLEFEKKKFEQELCVSRHAQEIAAREADSKERDYALREREFRRTQWMNPLLLAIVAAAIGFIANATTTLMNGYYNRSLEEKKSQQALLLEVIRTHDPDKAADNLKFLLDAHLYQDIDGSLRNYLQTRQPGTGISIERLPSNVSYSPDIKYIVLRNTSDQVPITLSILNNDTSVCGTLIIQPKEQKFFALCGDHSKISIQNAGNISVFEVRTKEIYNIIWDHNNWSVKQSDEAG